jgi:hypothetical protein
MTPDFRDVGIFIACAVVVLGFLRELRGVLGKSEKREITPQPLQVTAAPKLMTVEQCNQFHDQQRTDFRLMIQVAAEQFKSVVHEELRKTEEEHKERTDALRLEIKTDIGGVHEKINACAISIAEMRGLTEGG